MNGTMYICGKFHDSEQNSKTEIKNVLLVAVPILFFVSFLVSVGRITEFERHFTV